MTRFSAGVQAAVEDVLTQSGVKCWGVVSLADEDLLHSAVFQRARMSHARFVADGMQAGMFFLEKNSDVRERPSRVLPGVLSAIVVAVPYGNEAFCEGDFFRFVARYAWYRDYHKSVKVFLEEMGRALQSRLDIDFSFRAVVDSVPFWERAVAEMAGLGSVGKNTCLISKQAGSFVFLGTLLTSLAVEETAFVSGENVCGECMRCQGACPTRAFVEPYRLDARRCLAYWSIEHRGPVPDEFVSFFARTIFGCDVCQLVCPHNRKVAGPEFQKNALQELKGLELSVFDVATMTTRQYEEWFGGTSLTRAKYEGLVRNALYNLYATKSDSLDHAISRCLEIANPAVILIIDQISRLRGS